MKEGVPCFIKVRGCENCINSVALKDKTGKNFGFNPELMIGCVIGHRYVYSLEKPYYDPEQIVQYANKVGTLEAKEAARGICLNLELHFGGFYQRENISVPDILNKLDP